MATPITPTERFTGLSLSSILFRKASVWKQNQTQLSISLGFKGIFHQRRKQKISLLVLRLEYKDQ